MGLLKLKKNKSKNFDFKPVDLSKKLVEQLSLSVPLKSAYLFGSGVRNELSPDSDLDILVILMNIDDYKQSVKIVGQKNFSPIAVDWIFKSENDFNSRKEIGGVCFEAFHYGVKIYGS